MHVSKGSKTALTDARYTVTLGADPASAGLVDIAAVLLGPGGLVRCDDDLVFFNNPEQPGVRLVDAASVEIDLGAVPADVERVLVTGSTEAQSATFGDVSRITASVAGPQQAISFTPDGLTSETVVQVVALYRRGAEWKLDAIGQGYSDGLAAFAVEHGIAVDAPEPAPQIDVRTVRVCMTKDSPDKVARIDLRKSRGEPGWILTVALEWDGRGARYDAQGRCTRYGEGDLDVYFFCRNEETGDYVVISGEEGHRGGLEVWPHVSHFGDSMGPGVGAAAPASERVEVRPTENGDLLVNVYQSVDNGEGAIDTFGRPRAVVRYGKAGADGLPGQDADEITVYVGNEKDSYWATVAHIDVQDGVLTVDGETRYSAEDSEDMPGLDTVGRWVAQPRGGPVGQSKSEYGVGLTRYAGTCHPG